MTPVPAWARRLLDRTGRLERGICIGAFVLLIAAVFADVLSRELTGQGLFWALQAGVYANLVVVMVGLGLASQEGSHLRPRFADGWLPARWDPVITRVGESLTAAFFLVLTGVAADVVLETRELGERSPVLGTLVWPVQAIIPLVFAVATVRHGLYARYPGLRPAPPTTAGAD
jgi:C4-dicarboxylate transporter DctQ subunit